MTTASAQTTEPGRTPLLVGNWKMHGRAADLEKLRRIAAFGRAAPVDIVICPPTHLLDAAVQAVRNSPVAIGAQDCAGWRDDGARTGDINAAMLADIGVRYVIVGHSERRALHAETSALVRAKAQSVLDAGLIPIICVGETLDERRSGQACDAIAAQIADSAPEAPQREIVVAYEPIWCIGSDRTPTPAEIAEAQEAIRAAMGARTSLRVLYGGAIAPANAVNIFAVSGLDGVLVGRSSLDVGEFLGIAAASIGQHANLRAPHPT